MFISRIAKEFPDLAGLKLKCLLKYTIIRQRMIAKEFPDLAGLK